MSPYEIDPFTGKAAYIPEWLSTLCQEKGVALFTKEFFELLATENESAKVWVRPPEDKPEPSDDP